MRKYLILLIVAFVVGCGGTTKSQLNDLKTIVSEIEITKDFEQIQKRIILYEEIPEKDESFEKNTLKPNQKPDYQNRESIIASSSFPKWKKYEDKYISFYYPDVPLLTVKLINADYKREDLDIILNNIDFSYKKLIHCYAIMFNDNSIYCLMKFYKGDHFLYASCFCGGRLYTKYIYRDGGLYRFAVMKNGKPKYIQIRKGDYKVRLFEYPHLPIHPDIYLKIALNINIKALPVNEDKERERIKAKYGIEENIGFLEKGMSRKQVVHILGEPQRQILGSLIYVELRDRTEIIKIIDFQNDIFKGLKENWEEWTTLPSESDSVDRIYEKAKEIKNK